MFASSRLATETSATRPAWDRPRKEDAVSRPDVFDAGADPLDDSRALVPE
jgi:hypothetical protein